MFLLYAGGQIWLGGLDMNLDNNHRWLDGSLVASGYMNWYPGDPHNGGENNVAIHLPLGGFWADYTGTHKFKYICESGLI